MAKKPISRIRELSARVEAHLSQFEAMDDETDYSLPSQERRKKNPYARAGMAAGALAGAGAIAANKDKIRAGMQSAAGTMREAGRTAAFRGMRATAGAMNSAGNKMIGSVGRWNKKAADFVNNVEIGGKGSGKQAIGLLVKRQALKPTSKMGLKLKDGAKLLRKKSMKFFSRGAVDALLRIEEKIHRLETR